MTQQRPSPSQFRRRIRERDHVLGTFVKVPTPHATEILGRTGFDFVIVDQEHAPFDRYAIDLVCLASRAADIAAIVRVSEPTPASILSVLDCGATGIMVPHVDTPEKAALVAGACRYRGGHRGFANTTRAGGYGDASFADHVAASDAYVTCVPMIEDIGALDHLEAIVRVPGIDAIFIGRGDLTAAIGPERTAEAARHILKVAGDAGMPVMVLVSSKEDARTMRDLGASAFVASNDQNLLRAAATQALRDYGDPAGW